MGTNEGFCQEKNTSNSLKDVEQFAKEFFESFDNAQWKKCIEHVEKFEKNYLKIADEIPVDF